MIRLKDVVKSYKVGDNQINALNGVSLELEEGSYATIVGPSGSGKSTLFHIIGGLEEIDQGEVWVDEEPIHQLKDKELARIRREQIGFVFQQFQLLPTASALENVMMPLLNFTSSKTLRDKAAAVLERVGLGDRLDHLPSRLSGGEQQRVAIARAFITEPKVILADEPTGNLDSENGMKIIQLLEDFHQKDGGTVVMITHDLNLAERAEQKISILDGQIVSHDRRILT
ncbi:ABC transporter ATP-binding protein [Bacillus horti]|uniref:ABC transport system ATP-binding protein n=1 Tax=Caldalkalibacillus horti TaxID=77523 RepID=A0ABT9W435_9BACI|nr:ABC transporter ATP-binding protein [Bacillus horti]MDQ0167997.1 putative ABC transport system ATP-binding protein [Bacillus horti]